MSQKKKTGISNNDVTQKLFVEAGTGIGHEKDGQRRCLGCMELYSEEYEICPYCGYTIEEEVENALHMFPGTVLYDKYIIGRVIGYGGFGVTYLAWDTVLQIKVAIKEYLPSEFSTRAAGQTQITVFSGDKSKQFTDGMEKFIDEAKRLAKFRSENGIVKIFDSFSENGTAYIAMEYLQGETLAERLERDKTIPVEESIQMLMPIIESLNRVHDEGIIHRDIAPDNIFLTNKGEVKLIDFGASRYATTSRSRSLTVIIKPGFSAEEQYRSRGDQGSHTDVYSVGAVLYRMVTGQAPPDAMERRALFEKSGRDMLVPIKKFDKNIDQRRENAIYNALNIRIEDRTPDMISLAGELLSEEPVKKRRSGIKKIDPLTWPLWAKIGIPSGLVAVVTLCVLLAFGVIGPKSSLETDFVVPEGQTLVPNVVAGKLEDAQETLRKEGLNPKINGKVESVIIDRDLVLRQDPDALNVVNEGSIVNIIISDGRGMNLMPNVVEMTIENATKTLKEAEFEVAIVEEANPSFYSGMVFSQDFEPGTSVEKGTTVTIYVSTGPEGIDRTKQVIVPDIVGMSYEQAKKELAKYKLGAAIAAERYNTNIPENQVLGQLPVGNAKAYQGDTVQITVNRKAKLINVLDYVGKPYEDVAWELREAGLDVAAKYVKNDDYGPGIICGQDIKNKSVVEGTKITFTVAEQNLIKVPDLTGKSETSARQTLKDLKLTANQSVFEPSDTVGKGKVITHDFIGQEVEEGTAITLVVSSGKQSSDDNGDVNNQAAYLTSISITKKPNKTEYYVGDKFDSSGMEIVAYYSNSSNKNITSQCNFEGADLSSSGSATIKAKYEEGGIEKTASFNVKVVKPSVSIDNDYITIMVGGSENLSCETKPSGASVKWEISDSSIATVSGGSVRGVSAGTTTVTAIMTYAGKEYKNTATVNVSAESIPIKGVKIDQSNLTIVEQGSTKLTVTFDPSNTTADKTIKWKSSNTKVATVNDNGEVKGVSPGTATIRATASNGTYSECKVTVKGKVVAELIVSLNRDSYAPGDPVLIEHFDIKVRYEGDSKARDLTAAELKNVKISPSHIPANHSSSEPIKVEYGGKSKTFNVKVTENSVKITGVTSSKEITLGKGETKTLTTQLTPANMAVTWSSSNSNVATVDNKGVVTAKGSGTATITVASKDNSKIKDSITVKVSGEKTVQSIKVISGPNDTEYYVGEKLNTAGLVLKVFYSDNSDTTVSSDFKCSPEALNTATNNQKITVTYGGQETSFEVKVKEPFVKMSTVSLTVKEKNQKDISAEFEPFDKGEIQWSSSNTGVARVEVKSSAGNANAVIHGVAQGTATITATMKYGGRTYSATCSVTVEGNPVDRIEVDTGRVSKEQYIGDDFDASGLQLKVYYSGVSEPEYITDKFSITQDSDKSKKTQTIKVNYGGKSKEFEFTFKEPSFEVELKDFEIDANNTDDSIQIKTKGTPSEGWTFEFINLSPGSIEVKSGGLVKPKANAVEDKNASVKVTGTYKGVYVAEPITISRITVKKAVYITNVEVRMEDNTKKFKYGDVISNNDFYAIITYSDGTKDNYYTGTDLTVRLSDGGTKIVPGVVQSRGATVTAAIKGYDKTISLDITVVKPTLSFKENGNTIDAIKLENGDSQKVGLSVDDISTDDYEVIWSSTGPVSVSGDKSGVTVEATGTGSATVYATLRYNGYNKDLAKKAFDVTVESEPTDPSENLAVINDPEAALPPENEWDD